MRTVSIVFLALILIAANGWAQTADSAGKTYENKIELKGALGYANFIDDASLPHFVVGGAVRIGLFSGLGFQPELAYMYRSQRDRDFVLIPNLIWEFRRNSRIVPYFIGGAGLLNHRETFDTFNLSGNAWIFQGGFGTKIFLNPKVFIAPEARIGWEPHIRITGTVGYVLKR